MRILELKLPMGSVKTFCRSHPCIARGGYQLAYSCLFLQGAESSCLHFTSISQIGK